MKRKRAAKIFVFIAILSFFGALFAFDVFQYLRLDFLQEQRGRFAAFYAESPLLTISAFFAVYVLAAGFSVPGTATILSLAAGFLFDLFIGIIAVSFASSLGATMAFLISRFLFRDFAKKTLHSKWEAFDRRFREEGDWYLLSLRLAPGVPFFVVNALMGLSPMPVSRYFFISQLGMLPATAVYVNAGTQLAKIKSLGDIVSPALIFSLLAIALLPLGIKRALPLAASRLWRRA